MKNRFILLMSLIVFIFVTVFAPVTVTHAAKDITLMINDKKIDCDVAPMIVNDRTMVPVRVLFEHLNAEVGWNDALRQVTVTAPQTVMIFNINSTVAYINSESVTLDSAPLIINDRTLVPIRFISENLGYIVDWNDSTGTVFVNSKAEAVPPPYEDTAPSVPETDSDEENGYAAFINSIEVEENDDNIRITVSVTEKVIPKLMKLSNPDRLIFDFENTYQECKDGKFHPNDGKPVSEIRWARHDEYSRIVVQSEAEPDYKYDYPSSQKCVITVYKEGKSADLDDKSEADSEADAPVISDPVAGEAPEAGVPDGAPTVVIDAGHGGFDSGAVGRDDGGNPILYEKILTLDISKRVQKLLAADGINVVMTRTTDTALGDTVMKDLVSRCDIANAAGASLFVSIHINSFSNPEATGTSVLFSGLATNTDYDINGKQLAQNIQTPLVKATGLKDRGLVESPNMVVLKRTVMPAALVECAFISCKKDQAVLSSDEKLDDIAGAIYSGIVTSLNQMGKL